MSAPPTPFVHSCLYLVFLPLDGVLQLVQLVLQLIDDVRFSLYLVELRLPLALQQGTLHLRLEEWAETKSVSVTGELPQSNLYSNDAVIMK